ncbi:MAG: hypothetical protein WBF43_03075 [Methylocella sp.]
MTPVRQPETGQRHGGEGALSLDIRAYNPDNRLLAKKGTTRSILATPLFDNATARHLSF